MSGASGASAVQAACRDFPRGGIAGLHACDRVNPKNRKEGTAPGPSPTSLISKFMILRRLEGKPPYPGNNTRYITGISSIFPGSGSPVRALA